MYLKKKNKHEGQSGRNIALVTFDTKKIPRNCRKRQEKSQFIPIWNKILVKKCQNRRKIFFFFLILCAFLFFSFFVFFLYFFYITFLSFFLVFLFFLSFHISFLVSFFVDSIRQKNQRELYCAVEILVQKFGKMLRNDYFCVVKQY